MVRVIIDISVIVSSLIKPDGVSRLAFTKALKNCVLLCSFSTQNELFKVLNKPKFNKIDFILKRHLFDIIDANCEIIQVKSNFKLCRDPNDDMFLNLAIDGKADAIITRDPDLLVLHPFQGIPILNPADLLVWIETKI